MLWLLLITWILLVGGFLVFVVLTTFAVVNLYLWGGRLLDEDRE